jgi:hypothetical protein
MDLIYKFLCSVVATEAITELMTSSAVFEPLRKFFFNRRNNKLSNWIHELFDCGYCFSVWSAAFLCILLYIDNKFIEMFLIFLVIHRLSNLLHDIFSKIKWEDS